MLGVDSLVVLVEVLDLYVDYLDILLFSTSSCALGQSSRCLVDISLVEFLGKILESLLSL